MVLFLAYGLIEQANPQRELPTNGQSQDDYSQEYFNGDESFLLWDAEPRGTLWSWKVSPLGCHGAELELKLVQSQKEQSQNDPSGTERFFLWVGVKSQDGFRGARRFLHPVCTVVIVWGFVRCEPCS